MSYIIRDRVWTGFTIVDGNNPPRVGGFPLSNYYQGRKSLIGDYQDLTCYLGTVPEVLDRLRESCGILGGSETRSSSQMPIGDYLRIKTEFSPEDRQPETPDLTIGLGGTIDIQYPNGSIFVKANNETTDALAIRIKKNIRVIYNYGDYDDAGTPLAEDIGGVRDENNPYFEVNVLRMPNAGYGRCVATVTLTEQGKDRIKEMIREKRMINYAQYDGALHITNLGDSKVWTEILIVETVPAVGEYTANDHSKILVSGASYGDGDGAGAAGYILSQPHQVHKEMDFPAYRAVIQVPINVTSAKPPADGGKNHPMRYGMVPVWDFTSREVAWDDGNKLIKCTIKFKYVQEDGGSAGVTVLIRTRKGTLVNAEPVSFLQVTPLMPAPVWYKPNDTTPANYGTWGVDKIHHPLINPTILPPVKIEAFTKEFGYHFMSRATLKYTSLWTTTKGITEPDWKGVWKPLAYAKLTATAESNTAQQTAYVQWQGIPVTNYAAITMKTTELPKATKGVKYLAKLEIVESNAGPLTWKASAADFLTDVTLDPATGVIEGTVSQTGAAAQTDFTAETVFGVNVSLAGQTIDLNESGVQQVPAIEDISGLPTGYIGKWYTSGDTVKLKSSSDTATSWSKTTNLPAGLSIDRFGVISGVPQRAEDQNVALVATNDAGDGRATVTLSIQSELKPKIKSVTLTNATYNNPYGPVQFETERGVGPIHWKIISNQQLTCPEGLALSSDGVFSGTPSDTRDKGATFYFVVEAKNDFGSDVMTCKIKVNS